MPNTDFMIALLASLDADHRYFDPTYSSMADREIEKSATVTLPNGVLNSLPNYDSIKAKRSKKTTIAKHLLNPIELKKEKLRKVNQRLAQVQAKREALQASIQELETEEAAKLQKSLEHSPSKTVSG